MHICMGMLIPPPSPAVPITCMGVCVHVYIYIYIYIHIHIYIYIFTQVAQLPRGIAWILIGARNGVLCRLAKAGTSLAATCPRIRSYSTSSGESTPSSSASA